MRKIICFILLALAASTYAQSVSSRRVLGAAVVRRQTSDSLAVHGRLYADSLQMLFSRFQDVAADSARQNPMLVTNPYYFPLLSAGTLYNRPLQQVLGIDWVPQGQDAAGMGTGVGTKDRNLTTLHSLNDFLARMYATRPYLFVQTQQQMMEEGALVTDIVTPIQTENKLVEQIQLADIEHDVTDAIVAITRRPNFWTLRGSASLQFTQSYFSDNWFQGGDNNYSALSLFTLEANFDNKQKLQWENKLEAQLGFQTTKGDTCHSLKVTSNLLRLTSKVGYRAFKNWYYTARFQGNTQVYPNYNTNSYKVTTDFASPLYLALSLGMDFKWKLKRFEGSLYMAPIEVNARYVDRKELRSRYNDNADQATKWTWGPNVVVNYKWKIIDNIEWQGRLYWFTNFHYTNMEWENTFTFNVNKYLNCKLFVYPKYIDDKKYGKAKDDPERGYWMFKEWLSLGVSYNW